MVFVKLLIFIEIMHSWFVVITASLCSSSLCMNFLKLFIPSWFVLKNNLSWYPTWYWTFATSIIKFLLLFSTNMIVQKYDLRDLFLEQILTQYELPYHIVQYRIISCYIVSNISFFVHKLFTFSYVSVILLYNLLMYVHLLWFAL